MLIFVSMMGMLIYKYEPNLTRSRCKLSYYQVTVNALCQFGWNWPRVCGEEDWQWIRFSNFLIISPWKKAWPFIWTELVIPVLPIDALCQVWLKLARWFRRIRWKCENLRTERWRTDGKQAIWKLTWAFSSGELRS